MNDRKSFFQKTAADIQRYYPFTIGGSVLFVLAMLLLIRSLLIRDPYELVLAVIAIVILALLVLVARLQAVQFSKLHVQWDTSIPLIASIPNTSDNSGELQRLTGLNMKPFLWFRVHFLVRGRVAVGRDAWLRISQEISSLGGEAIQIPLSIPFAGTFDAEGILSIGDIFGLTKARFGYPIHRRMSVEPAVFPEEITIHVEAAEKTEEKQSQLNSDEDKYYMREYAPGDRFRDINWKTSSRLHQLFTRIAPVALEQTKVIAVELRNYREQRPETLDSVTHLSYLKSWLISFIRTVKEQNADFRFQIVTGHGIKQINSKEELAQFSDELAGMMFQGDPGVVTAIPETDEIFVFTTPYDLQLPALLALYPQRTINVVRTLTEDWTGGTPRRQFPLFRPQENLDLPGLWAFRGERKRSQPGIEHGGARVVGQQVVEARLA